MPIGYGTSRADPVTSVLWRALRSVLALDEPRRPHVPVLGIAAFFPAWLSAVGWNPFGWSFISVLTPPLSYAVRGVLVWMLVGVIYLAVLYVRDPQRVADVARIHLDEEPEPVS